MPKATASIETEPLAALSVISTSLADVAPTSSIYSTVLPKYIVTDCNNPA